MSPVTVIREIPDTEICLLEEYSSYEKRQKHMIRQVREDWNTACRWLKNIHGAEGVMGNIGPNF